MNSSMTDEVEFKTQSDRELLPKDRTILEREVMEYRPFGLDEQGYTIRDLSGVGPRHAWRTRESRGYTLPRAGSSSVATVVATVRATV